MTDVVENPAESAAAETEPVPINETITATEVDAEAAPITTEETVEGEGINLEHVENDELAKEADEDKTKGDGEPKEEKDEAEKKSDDAAVNETKETEKTEAKGTGKKGKKGKKGKGKKKEKDATDRGSDDNETSEKPGTDVEEDDKKAKREDVEEEDKKAKGEDVKEKGKKGKGKKGKGKKGKGEKGEEEKGEEGEGQKEEGEKAEDAENVIKEEKLKKKGKKGKKEKATETKASTTGTTEEDADKTKTKKKGKKGKEKKLEGEASVAVATETQEEVPDAIQDATGKSLMALPSSKSLSKLKVKSKSFITRSRSILMEKSLQSLMYLRKDESGESVESEDTIGSSELDMKRRRRRDKRMKRAESQIEQVSETVEPTTEEEIQEDSTKKKKGKKGKGKRKKVRMEDVESEPVLEETPIRLVPPFVPIPIPPEPEETEVVVVKKEKKKGKKGKAKGPKLTDKERRRLEQQRAEEARIQAELEAQKAAEEERIRLEQERKAAIEKEKREIAEQSLRVDQLQNCINGVFAIIEYNNQEDLKEKEQMEWQRYLKCDGLPDVSNCAEMNTYLHLWENELDNMTMDAASIKTDEVVGLLNELNDFIDNPVGVGKTKVDDWKWIRTLFRNLQNLSMETAIYKLLRDINKNLNRIDIPTADYRRKENNFGFCLWVMVQLPTPMYNPRAPAKPRIQVDFAELKANVKYPASIDCQSMAISAIYLKYDHLSDTCPHYEGYSCPEQYALDLNRYTFLEWDKKLRYKYERRVRNIPILDPESEEPPPPAEPEVDEFEVGTVPIVKYQKLEPTASQYVITVEDDLCDQIRLSMLNQVPPNVINLRKFLILGGIYRLNLYYQPPQPKEMVSYETVLAVLQIPKNLREVPFKVTYVPPPPVPALSSDTSLRKTPEEIEAEMKQQEMELDKLMLVTLDLPQHVMWFDLPIVGHWDPDQKLWTTDDIHDLRHVEEKGYLSFRTGTFGYFGLASYRYGNLPFQAWEIKPEADGSVTVQLTAAVLMFEFNIKEGLISVTQLQNGPNDALQEIVGTYMKLSKLKRVLLEGGVDIFPTYDSFSYIEGTCEKSWPMERHLYYDMARLSTAFNFAWSRWNLLAGRRNIVFQMREYKLNKPKQKPHSLCLVTPLKALYVDCTEVSQTFNDEGIPGMKFYADLMNVVRGTSSMSLKTKILNAPQRTVMTVANFLLATRIMSLA